MKGGTWILIKHYQSLNQKKNPYQKLRQCYPIKKKKIISKTKILLSQFKDPIVYVLLAAVVLSAVVHETVNAII